MALADRRIAFIGGGNITGFLIQNFTKTQTAKPKQMIVSDPNTVRLDALKEKYAVSTTTDNLEAVSSSDFVFINVPPHVVPLVIRELKTAGFPADKLLVTLAAGISISAYESLGDRLPVVRILPNPPSQIGQGVIAITYNEYVIKSQKMDFDTLLDVLGMCIEVEERLINAVMAMTTPANVLLFFQSLIDAGIRQGIDLASSTKIAYQTIVGSMAVWQQRQAPPSELIAEGNTPGGISVESLYVLEKHAMRAAIYEAVAAATNRAAEFNFDASESD